MAIAAVRVQVPLRVRIKRNQGFALVFFGFDGICQARLSKGRKDKIKGPEGPVSFFNTFGLGLCEANSRSFIFFSTVRVPPFFETS